MAASNLTLVLPPLSFSGPENDQFISLLDKNSKSLASLRRVLTRGENQSFDTQELILTELFGLPYATMDKLPLAAINAVGSGFDAATGYWFYAEPVHLYPDLDHVLLFDRDSFELTKQELGRLIEELQELFEESGLTPYFGKQNKLYIRTDDEAKVSFTALSEVSGKNILQHLPDGVDSAQWRLLQNEIQMQMTQSSVNQRREERGERAINGLWFWGGGYLFRAKYQRCYEAIFTKNLFVTGLAKMTDGLVEKQGDDFDSINTEKKTFVSIVEPEATPSAGINMLLEFDRQWLKPALAAIKKGELEYLTLVTGKTRTVFTREQHKRLWKRAVRIEKMASLLS